MQKSDFPRLHPTRYCDSTGAIGNPLCGEELDRAIDSEIDRRFP